MNILVIDDDHEKSWAILQVFTVPGRRAPGMDVTIVETLADAVRVINRLAFDLVVLDLMLPYVQDGSAQSRAGIELLRQLRRDDCPNRATKVVCISRFRKK